MRTAKGLIVFMVMTVAAVAIYKNYVQDKADFLPKI